MVNHIEELGSISEHGNFSDSTKVDTRTEGDDDTDVDEVRRYGVIHKKLFHQLKNEDDLAES